MASFGTDYASAKTLGTYATPQFEATGGEWPRGTGDYAIECRLEGSILRAGFPNSHGDDDGDNLDDDSSDDLMTTTNE